VPPKGEPLEPRFDRGEIAKNQTYMPPVLVSLLPMECMKRDTIIRWMNAMEWMYNQWTSRASVSKKSASGGEMRISKSPQESVANPANPGSVRICESDLEPSQLY